MKERSIFWPLVMIAVGVLWLLNSMGVIPSANFWALTHLFPFLLIALGLGLILRAYWRYGGMLISLLVVAGAVLAVIYAPQFGWNNSPNWGWNIIQFEPGFGGRITGSGVVETETHQLEEFNALVVEYPAEIVVRQGDSERVIIEAEDNLLPQLGTEVRGDTLYFESTERYWDNRVNPTEPVFVTLTVIELKDLQFSTAGKLLVESLFTDSLELSISGAGDVTLEDLDAESLDFSLSGAGNAEADGIIDNLEMRISGMGNFNGGDLQTQNAEVRISGAGNATLWVEERLDANISGAGSIDYYGNPDINKNVSGVGSIDKIGDK
jgi:hypothetical protein